MYDFSEGEGGGSGSQGVFLEGEYVGGRRGAKEFLLLGKTEAVEEGTFLWIVKDGGGEKGPKEPEQKERDFCQKKKGGRSKKKGRLLASWGGGVGTCSVRTCEVGVLFGRWKSAETKRKGGRKLHRMVLEGWRGPIRRWGKPFSDRGGGKKWPWQGVKKNYSYPEGEGGKEKRGGLIGGGKKLKSRM